MLDFTGPAINTIPLNYDLIINQQTTYQALLLAEANRSQSHLSLNCARVRQIDRHGVQFLLLLKQLLKAKNFELYLINLPTQIQIFMELIQADKLLLTNEYHGVTA